jgi:hypothetical protein
MRTAVIGPYLALLDQCLIEQAHVDHHAQRHVGVNGALELDQQVEIDPLATHLHPPDKVVGSLAEVFADVAARNPLQRAVVQVVQPVVRHEAEDQVTHQFGRREEKFVAAVVIVCHRCILPAYIQVRVAAAAESTTGFLRGCGHRCLLRWRMARSGEDSVALHPRVIAVSVSNFGSARR